MRLPVSCPRFERTAWAQPGTPTPGDEASIAVEAGLIAWLDEPVAGTPFTLGAGYQPRYTVPFGLAVTAALGSLGAVDPLQDRWTVRSAVIGWTRAAQDTEALSASARVICADERHAEVVVDAAGDNQAPIFRATVRLVALREGRYAAVDASQLPPAIPARVASAISPNPGEEDDKRGNVDLFDVRTPELRFLGTRCEAVLPPDLVLLLLRPVAGRAEPLGRRVHPLGAFPLGAAITVAFLCAGESDATRPTKTRLQEVAATWYRAAPLDTPIVAAASRIAEQEGNDERCDVAVRDSDGRVVLSARCRWTRDS